MWQLLTVFFGRWPKPGAPGVFLAKPGVPENIRDRECCWPYLIGHHPFLPVFGQKRPSAPDYFYFAQVPLVFDHLLFPSGRLLEQTSTDDKQISKKSRPCDVEIDKKKTLNNLHKQNNQPGLEEQ